MSAPSAASAAAALQPAAGGEVSGRVDLEALAREHFSFIWRSLRRLGVPHHAVDDAAQQVFEVAARRLDEIEPERAKAFLFKSALFVASEARRAWALSHARAAEADVDTLRGSAPSPEDSALTGEKRALMDRVLNGLEPDLRTVFVLYELEELELQEIAELVGIPRGTVASRLRRAREAFHAEVKRLRARLTVHGGLRD
jgi:RNA polymerase sigma-70 factor (ECF subfamily)